MPLQTGGACQIDHCLQTTLILAGQAFDLEAIESMSAAFVAACDGLHLEIGDPAARFVAEKSHRARAARHPRSECTSRNDAERVRFA